MSKNDYYIGISVALLVGAIIIFSIEKNLSWIQIGISFLIFIFPFIFISSFKSKVASFTLTLVSLLFVYFSLKLNYKDTWVGVLLALVIGGSVYFFAIRKTENFSTDKQIKKEIN